MLYLIEWCISSAQLVREYLPTLQDSENFCNRSLFSDAFSWALFVAFTHLSALSLRLSRWLPRLFARVLPTPATHHAPLPSWLRRPFFAPTTQRNESRRIRNYRCNLLMQPEDPTKGYLTIISLVRVGYEMEDSQRGEEHLISNKREWKKTPTKYRECFPTLLVKTTDFQLVFNFEQTCTVIPYLESMV